jgi:hypothetical protein
VLPGYGGNVRLGTAVSVSGAAASPNAGYHSSPLVTILMTVLNARLGLWFGNPARDAWRRSGPGFALYLVDELFGRTTSKGKYVYLSDGGHFENLGVYELIRRRCRHIVLCDAGADPELSFWDLGSLVRKCREDFGVRIEIDVRPLLKKDGTSHAKWHCAVGRIHYQNVDEGANPGTLFYVKPSLTGDEPSDVRNYVVDHPSFPHESTADQFFSESQFESYRVLGEHIAMTVFSEVVQDAGLRTRAASFFSRLRRRWFPPPPDLDKTFIESVKAFVDIHKDLRGNSELHGISHELYPELKNLLELSRDHARNKPPDSGPAGDENPEVPTSTGPAGKEDAEVPTTGGEAGNSAAEVHTVIQMLQAMENAWIALDLEAYSDHPLNRGWMNVFRRWTSSATVQRHWPMVRGEFSEGFVRFCEAELNLTVHDPEVIWFNPDVKASSDVGLAQFDKAIKDLDKEFTLEWPNVVWREIGDAPASLAKMFEHARDFPPQGGSRVGLIRCGARGPHEGPTTEPSDYGVILAWEVDNGLIDLVVWVRGAYRTLGYGETIAKGLDQIKTQLRTGYDRGYTLRTRYPSDRSSRIKQHWQSTLWSDFFQNQGFQLEESDPLGDEMVTLVYRYRPI